MNAKIRDKPPKARKKKSKNKVHGVTLIDDYAWLRDDNWQKAVSYTHLTLPTSPHV